VRLTACLAALVAGGCLLSACGGSKTAATPAQVQPEPRVPYAAVRASYDTWHKALVDYRAKRTGPGDIDRTTDGAFRVAESFDDWHASKGCAAAVRAYAFVLGSYRERLLRGELNDTLAATVIEAGQFMKTHCRKR
jgi:hypothetical protein